MNGAGSDLSVNQIGTLYDGKRQRMPGKRNPDYKTRVRALPREQWVPIEVPAIIDFDLYEAAQRQLKANQIQSKRNRKAEDGSGVASVAVP